MANENKTLCNCQGFYNHDTGLCDPLTENSPNPCPPTFWGNVAGWDWNNISNQAVTWAYALGILTPPNATNMETQAYMQELQRQKQTMMYLMVGLGVMMLVLVIVVIRKK